MSKMENRRKILTFLLISGSDLPHFFTSRIHVFFHWRQIWPVTSTIYHNPLNWQEIIPEKWGQERKTQGSLNMCETRDAAIALAQASQLPAFTCSPSAKSAIPLTMSHSSWVSNAAVKTPKIWKVINILYFIENCFFYMQLDGELEGNWPAIKKKQNLQMREPKDRK